MSWKDTIKDESEQPKVSSWKDTIVDDSNSEEWKSKASDIPTLQELKAGAAGAAESFTFGFAPEIAGGAQALASSTFGDDKYSDLLETYKKYSAEREKDFRDLEKESPNAYLTGEIAGGLGQAAVTGIATGGLSTAATLAQGTAKLPMAMNALKLAGIGAGSGALTGAGYSKESAIDALSGNSEAQAGLAKDIGIGAGLGAAGNVAAPIIGKGLGKGLELGGKAASKTFDFAAGKIDTIADLQKAYNFAKQGISVTGPKAKKAINEEARDIAEQIVQGFDNQIQAGSDFIGEILKKSKPSQDISAVLKEAESIIQNNPGITTENKNRLLAVINNNKVRTVTETFESGKDIAKKELEKKQLKKMAEAEALGEQDVSFSPTEDFGEFLQTVKTQKSGEEILDKTLVGQEGTGIAKANDLMKQKLAKEQLKASTGNKNIEISDVVFDEESGSLVANLTTKNSDGTQSIRPIFQKVPKDDVISNPIFGDKNTANVLQQDVLPDRITTKTVDELKDMDLQGLYAYRKALASEYDNMNMDYGGRKFIEAEKDRVDNVVKSMVSDEDFAKFTEGKELYSDVKKAGKNYKVDKNDPLSKRAIDVKSTLLKDENAKGMENLEESLKFAREEYVPQSLREEARTLSSRMDLNKTGSGQALTPGTPLGIFAGSVGASSVRAGEALGAGRRMLSKVAKTPREFTRGILNSGEDKLYKIATKLPPQFAESMINALKDTTKKDRALWSLAQQPAFREAVNRAEEEEANTMDELLGQ